MPFSNLGRLICVLVCFCLLASCRPAEEVQRVRFVAPVAVQEQLVEAFASGHEGWIVELGGPATEAEVWLLAQATWPRAGEPQHSTDLLDDTGGRWRLALLGRSEAAQALYAFLREGEGAALLASYGLRSLSDAPTK